MSTKQAKSKSRKNKKKSANKQKLSHLLSNNNNNSNSNCDETMSCRQGDSFNIEEWISSLNHDTEKLSSQMLPTRAAAIKAKNGLTNQSGFGSYDKAKERDPRSVINDNRLFYEEYIQPFKCIQLFNQANLELLAYKLHTISNDQQQ